MGAATPLFISPPLLWVESIRGVSNLYVELALLAVVLSVGSTLLAIANSISSSATDFSAPPKISAYLVQNRTVVVSWDDRLLRVELVCPNLGVVSAETVSRGVRIFNYVCDGLTLAVSGYVIRPLRVL